MTRFKSDVQRLTERRGTMKARDGAIVDPVVDEINGIQWFFKYHKGAFGKYKWLAMGAQVPLVSTGGTITPTPINTGVAGAAFIPVPFNGIFLPGADISFGGSGSGSTVMTWWWYIDNSTQIGAYQRTMTLGTVDTWNGEPQTPFELAAQHVINLGVSTSALGMVVNSHGIRLTPNRIAI